MLQKDAPTEIEQRLQWDQGLAAENPTAQTDMHLPWVPSMTKVYLVFHVVHVYTVVLAM